MPSNTSNGFGSGHPAPELIPTFVYGLPEVHAPYEAGVRRIANPGCFATGISLALWPLTRHIESLHACVVALTGASGSGVLPKATTHFPTRDGNVRAYKTLTHQHLPEIDQVLEQEAVVWFVPVSGPWTRGHMGYGPDATAGGRSGRGCRTMVCGCLCPPAARAAARERAPGTALRGTHAFL